jgi:hypothetical protein
MTKTHIYSAAALIPVVVMSCNGSIATGTTDELTEKRVKVERTVRLTDDPNSPFYDINKLQNEYRDEMLDFYLADLKENNGDTSTLPNYNYAYHLDTEVEKGYKDVLCYKMDGYRYSAGAHGINFHQYINFDKEGNPLTLSDIFHEGYEEELLSILTRELMDKFHVTSTQALQEKGFVDANQLYVTDNFQLEDDEIEFVYNEYEIAPYSMGTVKVDIDYKDIKHLMKKEWR